MTRAFVRTSYALATLAVMAAPHQALATPFTLTSPTGGLLPAGVSAVGGIVLDLTGLNGTRVVSQVAASTEFIGQPAAAAYPLLFGTQTGYDATVVSALGGGIASASFRITLYDGDNQLGNFDYLQNTLLVNGVNFGDFTNVATQQTDGTGTTLISSGTGFGNGTLDTGFFSSLSAATLASLYATLISGQVTFQVNDLSPGDQFYDFTQGLDASVINVGSGPVVVPPGPVEAPEPAALSLLGAGLAAMLVSRRRVR